MAMQSASLFRLLAASCAILAIGLAGCGGDDAETVATSNDKAAADEGSKTTAGKPATDEGQIRALVARAEKTFKTGDGEGVCDTLTLRGQRDIVKFGTATGLSGKQCPDVAAALIERERDAGTEQYPARVLSVRVRGSRAVALIRVGGGAPTLRQRYVKENGEWRIGSLNLAVAAGV